MRVCWFLSLETLRVSNSQTKDDILEKVKEIQGAFNDKVRKFTSQARIMDVNTAQQIEFSKNKAAGMRRSYQVIEETMKKLYANTIGPGGFGGPQIPEVENLRSLLIDIDQRLGK
jgi:RNA polymerase-binding transcription factor DksA